MNHNIIKANGAHGSMHQATIVEDRRRYPRTRCSLPVAVDDYETTSSGKVLNLGKGGAYVQTTMEEMPEVGRVVIVTIPFHNRANYLIIKARVAWTQNNGMGITFLTPYKLN